MKIIDMFEKGTVYSFEIFPPKKDSPIEIIYNTLEELGGLKPDFISVTYGAGGSSNGVSTCEIAKTIKEKHGIEPMAHLPCINYTQDEITDILEDFKKNGIENILALRGDINPNIPPKEEFKYASDLVGFIKDNGDFDIAGACYPEGHIDTLDMVEDIHNLKKKVDMGVTHLITQLFFDNSFFYSFVERAKIAGINVPIEAGIMPVTNKKSIERMVSMCGTSIPPKFAKMMQKYENNPEALRDAGIAYAIDQIVDLVSNGVDGIHLYTMNNAYVARRISEAVEKLIRG
ncbi:MAG: methylenetetrahydrofolate reductase [NAD(P)H] [Clostridium sp.]|nr:methylenetetrahydrofolate reductase [NAD(P)H] [Clostridium sp.]MCM1546752.1 methylenetetrahydrofolate reductase [NAD(P)H] [Ruminococcus sp.]